MNEASHSKRPTETEIQTPKTGGTDTQGIEFFRHKTALLFTVYFTLIGLCALAIIGMGEKIWTLQFWGGGGDLSAVVRNLGLVAIGVIGMPFAIWRAMTAYGQSQAAIDQARIANRQADLAEKGLIIDRFQKGAQMLESNELSLRLAGIYTLRELATSDPDETYLLVLDLLCDFVRERSKVRDKSSSPVPGLLEEQFGPFPTDLKKAMETICWVRQKVPDAFSYEPNGWRLDLSAANLSSMQLPSAFLSKANLSYAKLAYANLTNADLRQADLSWVRPGKVYWQGVNLSKADLNCANLSNADLRSANMSEARLFDTDLSGANLYRAQLSGALSFNTNFSKANLFFAAMKQIQFSSVNLFEADLSEANLSNACLSDTNISNAFLYRSNLEGAELRRTNLTDANLSEATLTSAHIQMVNLSGAKMRQTVLSETIIESAWAYADTPPSNDLRVLTNSIAFRNDGETWNDFVDRTARERPDLGWTSDLKGNSPD